MPDFYYSVTTVSGVSVGVSGAGSATSCELVISANNLSKRSTVSSSTLRSGLKIIRFMQIFIEKEWFCMEQRKEEIGNSCIR